MIRIFAGSPAPSMQLPEDVVLPADHAQQDLAEEHGYRYTLTKPSLGITRAAGMVNGLSAVELEARRAAVRTSGPLSKR